MVALAMVIILIPLKRNVGQASNLSERFVGITKQLTKNNISCNSNRKEHTITKMTSIHLPHNITRCHHIHVSYYVKIHDAVAASCGEC